jgi:FtsX-like permease family
MGSSLQTTAVKASTTNIATNVGYTGVSPEYFELFDIQIVRGRPFTPAEAAAGSAVALSATRRQRRYGPGWTPSGRPSKSPQFLTDAPTRDCRVVAFKSSAWPRTYRTARSWMASMPPVSISCGRARSREHGAPRPRRTDDDILPTAVTAAVNKVAPDTPFQLFSLRANVAEIAWVFRGFSLVISVLGVVGLLFAYSGTHAVVSFLMAQRKREFGVRMALGASARQIVLGMLIQTSRAGLIGLAVGLVVAAGLVRLLTSVAAILDFGARPFVVGAATVFIATTLAALIPLLGTARIDPAQTLRSE